MIYIINWHLHNYFNTLIIIIKNNGMLRDIIGYIVKYVTNLLKFNLKFRIEQIFI